MGQYLHLDSWLIWTVVHRRAALSRCRGRTKNHHSFFLSTSPDFAKWISYGSRRLVAIALGRSPSIAIQNPHHHSISTLRPAFLVLHFIPLSSNQRLTTKPSIYVPSYSPEHNYPAISCHLILRPYLLSVHNSHLLPRSAQSPWKNAPLLFLL